MSLGKLNSHFIGSAYSTGMRLDRTSSANSVRV